MNHGSPPPLHLRVERLDGGLLVMDGAALAKAFFGSASDSVVPRTAADKIETRDVEELNRTMRARSPYPRWASIADKRLPWLAAIDPDLDLIQADDSKWEVSSGEQRVEAALAGVVGEGRGVAVATKMLYLKRPRLFPMLDRLLVEMLGGGVSSDAPADTRASQAARLVVHLRREGRANLPALREIQSQLGIDLSLIRILDAVLWSSHPAAALSGIPRSFGCRLLDRPVEA